MFYRQIYIPTEGKDYPPTEPPMRQDFKEPVKWFDDDEEEALGDYEELETITEVAATQKRLAGNKKYTGLTLVEIDKHAKNVSFKNIYLSLTICICTIVHHYDMVLHPNLT